MRPVNTLGRAKTVTVVTGRAFSASASQSFGTVHIFDTQRRCVGNFTQTSASTEPAHRIHWLTCGTDLDVERRFAAATTGADRSEDLAGGDPIAGFFVYGFIMPIKAHKTIPVIHDNQ